MTAQEQVARLEALLTRVHTRRDAPRPVHVETAAAAPAPVHAPSPTPAPVAARPVVPAVAFHAPAPVVPPAPVTPAPDTPAPHTTDGDVDVEVMAETAEIDLEGIDADELAAASADGAAGPAEAAEELPASSRRPIHIEPPLAELTFGETAEAKGASHPAPPESGRQVALPTNDLEGELSGVRPLVESIPGAAPATPPPAAPPAAPAAHKADVTQPLAAAGPAAVFRGAAPEWKPQTFGDLLDSTLGL